MNIRNFAKALTLALIASTLPLSAQGTVHDSSANGNSIVFSDYAGSPTTFSATAVTSNITFQCFAPTGPLLPEVILQVSVGPSAGAGSVNTSGGSNASRFVISWLQASTSQAVTFSPRFVSRSVNSGSTPRMDLTINYTTFSLQVAAADTVTLSYAAPIGGDNDIYAAPTAGGAATSTNKPLSFSNLVITPTSIPTRVGSCYPAPPGGSTPTVTSAGTALFGRAVRLALSSSVGDGLGGPVSDFAVAVNGEAVPIQSIVRRGTQLDLELGLFQIGRTSTVTVAKVGSSFNYGTAPNVLANFSARSVTNDSTATIVNQSSAGTGGSATPAAPIKYSGPEFSELSLKPALSGTSTRLEGRRLDQISSVTIGGKAAVLSNATDKSVNLGLPAGLVPGVYDLIVTTASHGKLTHMNAIRIREELVPTSLTIQGTGVLSGEEFKKLTAFARTQNPDMNTVTCIVNSGSEGKSFTQVRALCDRIAAANPNIKTTQFEVRSTVKSSAIFARVVFSHEE